MSAEGCNTALTAIDRYLMALSSKPARRHCCWRSLEETDQWTPHRYIDPAPHTIQTLTHLRRCIFHTQVHVIQMSCVNKCILVTQTQGCSGAGTSLVIALLYSLCIHKIQLNISTRRGRGGRRPPLFSTGGRVTHFFGLKFVQKCPLLQLVTY